MSDPHRDRERERGNDPAPYYPYAFTDDEMNHLAAAAWAADKGKLSEHFMHRGDVVVISGGAQDRLRAAGALTITRPHIMGIVIFTHATSVEVEFECLNTTYRAVFHCNEVAPVTR